MSILRTEGLSIGHGHAALLSGIDLDLQQDQLVALIGLNGSGKSTLLRTLAGLQLPLAGRIHVGGQELGVMTSMARALNLRVLMATERINRRP